jgi:thioredoxin reductase (NADPH)
LRDRELTVVVGAGPAGCAAAVQCARLGAPVRLFDRSGRAGGLIANGLLIENYPGLEQPLPGPAFATRLGEHLARFGVAVEPGELLGLEPTDHGWLCRFDRTELPCRNAILCTGTAPRPFAVTGDPGTVARAVFHEVLALFAAVPSPRRAIVVGGGEAAFYYSLTLAAAGAEVTIAVRGPGSRARGRLAGLVADNPSIRVALQTRLVELSGAGEWFAARAVSTTGEERWECDGVLAAVGRSSTVADLVGAVADDAAVQTLTPRPGLFICGDARSGALGQAGIAVGDGLRAATGAVERIGEESG